MSLGFKLEMTCRVRLRVLLEVFKSREDVLVLDSRKVLFL